MSPRMMYVRASSALGVGALLSLAGGAHGAILDWGSGWASANGDGSYLTGAMSNSTNVDGVAIDVSVETFGTATGFNSFLGTTPDPRTDYNGDQGPDDPALAIGDSNSFNPGATFDNYVLVTIGFSTPVDILDLAIGDIDISSGNQWQDVVAVRGKNAGSDVLASYDPESNAFFETRTYDFPGSGESFRGVTGTQNAGNSTDDAQFDVSFAGLVDTIEIYYWNGPDSSGSNGRGIYIQDIEFVPTPGAGALAAIALAGLGIRRRK